LASRGKSEEYKNGSVCKTAADVFKPEIFLAGVEVAQPLQQTGEFRLLLRKIARQQAIRSSVSPEEENTARIPTDRNQGCGLAYLSALGWNDAGRDRRTSAHNPRLPAATIEAMEERGLISPGKGRDPLTIVWRLKKKLN
jgi:hypothetical protein